MSDFTETFTSLPEIQFPAFARDFVQLFSNTYGDDNSKVEFERLRAWINPGVALNEEQAFVVALSFESHINLMCRNGHDKHLSRLAIATAINTLKP